MSSDVKQRVECECGTIIEAFDDDDLIRATNEHTTDFHGMTLPPDVILAKARPVP